jgi:hypothetical protein
MSNIKIISGYVSPAFLSILIYVLVRIIKNDSIGITTDMMRQDIQTTLVIMGLFSVMTFQFAIKMIENAEVNSYLIKKKRKNPFVTAGNYHISSIVVLTTAIFVLKNINKNMITDSIMFLFFIYIIIDSVAVYVTWIEFEKIRKLLLTNINGLTDGVADARMKLSITGSRRERS